MRNTTNHTYQQDSDPNLMELLNLSQGEESGEHDKMDIDAIVKLLGGENVRALLNNTELHEKIAEHINTYLPPRFDILK